MKVIIGVLLIVYGSAVLIQLARKRPVSRWAFLPGIVLGILAIFI